MPEGVESRSVRGSLVQQVARYMELRSGCVFRATKCTLQYEITLRVEKTRGCANVKQCKLKAWGVAVVDLWLFFAYHAEVKV